MADLSEKDSSQAVKIVGADNTGAESNYAQVNSDGSVNVRSAFANDYTTTSLGTLRVAESQNVFESLFSFNKQPLIWDEVLTLGGTSTFNAVTNSVDMTVPTTSGASVVRQIYRRVRYNPSRTVQVLMAGTIGAGKANVRKRIGQFDTEDGVFFEIDGTTAYVVRRSSTSGVVVDTRTAQASWNIDRFDGTGPSGIVIDFSKHQLFFMQYAFQGFGDVAYGFYSNGRVLFCHRETIANVSAVPSLRTAHLPARVEITNTGISASPTTLSYNSFCVKHEGKDLEQEGQVRSYSDAPLKTIGTTKVPVISIRIGPGFEKAITDLVKTNIFVNSADEVVWSLVADATLTGATFSIPASYNEIDTAATAMSGGTELVSGILGQQNSASELSQELLEQVNSFLGVSISGTARILTLAARSRAGTADILSAIVWKEYP